jgi:hypothetical protein
MRESFRKNIELTLKNDHFLNFCRARSRQKNKIIGTDLQRGLRAPCVSQHAATG